MTKKVKEIVMKGQPVVSRKSVRQMIQGELLAKSEVKVQATAQLAQASATAGTVLNVTQQIIQGDTLSQRTGNQVSLVSLAVRLDAYLSVVGVVNSSVRIITFQDTQNVGVIPAVTDVLNAANYSSFYNVSEQYQQKRFKILDDYSTPMAYGGSNQAIHHYRVFKGPRLNRQVTYQGTANVAGANGRNAVFVIVIFEAALAGTTFDLNTLVRYTDL